MSRLRIATTASPECWTRRGASRPSFDLQTGQPVQPAGEVPVPLSEQLHRAWEHDRADDRRIDQQRGGDTEAHLLEHDQVAAREAREDRHDDQRRSGDDPRRGGNAERHGVSGRIRFARTSFLTDIQGPFDLIVANPPYVPRSHQATLSPDVRDHEPAVALFGRGEDGLDDVRELLGQSATRLAPSGRVMMEFGYGQGDAVRAGAERAGLDIVDILRDLQGHERTLIAARRSPRAAL